MQGPGTPVPHTLGGPPSGERSGAGNEGPFAREAMLMNLMSCRVAVMLLSLMES